jgi:DNA helicase-2/ATP-dependent DNA helicase PcrA
MPSPRQLAVIAAAGSHKTEYIVNQALASADRRVLLTTYTLNNLACIEQRIYQKVGHIPPHITLMSWYGFLMHHWCRPYQRALLGAPNIIRGVDFKAQRPRYVSEAKARQYFCTGSDKLYKDRVADFAVKANTKSDGAAIRRLEELYDELYIDEVQDLAYYDLGVLEALLRSDIHVIMVGDPRQHTYATNQHTKDGKYRGAAIVEWLGCLPYRVPHDQLPL